MYSSPPSIVDTILECIKTRSSAHDQGYTVDFNADYGQKFSVAVRHDSSVYYAGLDKATGAIYWAAYPYETLSRGSTTYSWVPDPSCDGSIQPHIPDERFSRSRPAIISFDHRLGRTSHGEFGIMIVWQLMRMEMFPNECGL